MATLIGRVAIRAILHGCVNDAFALHEGSLPPIEIVCTVCAVPQHPS